jgi:aminopeptidase N
MKVVLFALFMSVGALAQMPKIEPGVSHDLAIWRVARYSDVRYKLNLTLEKMSPVLKGTIEVRVNVKSPDGGELTEQQIFNTLPIVLDWRKITGHEQDSVVSNVSLNGSTVLPVRMMTPVSDRTKGFYQERDEHLIFQGGVKLGENVIKLDFTSPILASGSAITRYVDKEDGLEYIYSLFVPSDASTAFPVFDQPDLKARFQLSVLAPKKWHVIANAREAAAQDYLNVNKEKEAIRHIFPTTEPISTYVFAFACGEFAGIAPTGSFSSTAVLQTLYPTDPATEADKASLNAFTRIFVRKSQAEKFKPHADEVFRLTREGIKYLEEYFDYKFPFLKYDIVLIPEFPFGGMEHAGATFLRESSILFPSEPTANDYISRANVIFHEAAHQWFGDTVTMKWFDDLWLKEGFAEFMAFKTLEKVMPQYNAWKAFYERNKQAAYLTDSTKGTTAIYQPIENLSAAKSAYGNIVYRKAPSFLRQAEFYLGPDKFQTAVRAFLKKHEFANAGWEDLVKEFEAASGQDLNDWGSVWVKRPGLPTVLDDVKTFGKAGDSINGVWFSQRASSYLNYWTMKTKKGCP